MSCSGEVQLVVVVQVVDEIHSVYGTGVTKWLLIVKEQIRKGLPDYTV